MAEVPAHNNNGLFRRRKHPASHSKRKRHGRLFIRRSRIDPALTNNSVLSSPNNFTVNYHPSTARWRHNRIRQSLLHGAGDEHGIPPASTQQKQVDFTELEQIFDNAIRNRLPLELYKTKSPIQIDPRPPSVSALTATAPETRIELANSTLFQPAVRSDSPSSRRTRHQQIALGLVLIVLSALIGFTTVVLFVK